MSFSKQGAKGHAKVAVIGRKHQQGRRQAVVAIVAYLRGGSIAHNRKAQLLFQAQPQVALNQKLLLQKIAQLLLREQAAFLIWEVKSKAAAKGSSLIKVTAKADLMYCPGLI